MGYFDNQKGKAFEYFIKKLLIAIGFSEVSPDGLYIFNGSPGLMINGLGEAHNADVLVEPPVQTPFYNLTRLLVECKAYSNRIGINVIRSAVGLRLDVNSFDIVDLNELTSRRRSNRPDNYYIYSRYQYQVAVASLNGFTVPAQNFAATHRIPLIELNKMPFWESFSNIINPNYGMFRLNESVYHVIDNLIEGIKDRIAVAITNSGQLLFLLRVDENESNNESLDMNYYSLEWTDKNHPWKMIIGKHTYLFQLPNELLKTWINESNNDVDLRKNAINCKLDHFSNMVMYYKVNEIPKIKIISIYKQDLYNALNELQ